MKRPTNPAAVPVVIETKRDRWALALKVALWICALWSACTTTGLVLLVVSNLTCKPLIPQMTFLLMQGCTAQLAKEAK